MKGIFLSLLFFLFAFTEIGAQQKKLDSLLGTFNNDDLFIYIILRGSTSFSKTPEEIKTIAEQNKKKIIKPFRKNCRIVSMGMTVEELLKEYPIDSLSVKVLALFDNVDKDLYAHALLTEIFKPRELLGVMKLKREDWRSDGRKERFRLEWEKLFRDIGYLKDADPK